MKDDSQNQKDFKQAAKQPATKKRYARPELQKREKLAEVTGSERMVVTP